MKFSPDNAQHIGSRSEQQDSFGFSDPSDNFFAAHGGVAAVVADGMGGLAHGSAASQTAVRAFLEAYQQKKPDESIPGALLRSVTAANKAVVDLACGMGAKNELGTTLAAAVMHQQWLHWISVGDSRVYLYRNGQLVRLTMDHIYANDLDEQVAKGETTQLQAMQHPERASLTSYLGLPQLPKIERNFRAFPLQSGDCALICSDGLYRALSENEVAAVLRKNNSEICETLIQEALAKGNPAQDNVTVLVLKCGRSAVLAVKPDVRKTALVAAAGSLAVIAAVTVWYATKPAAQQLGAGNQSAAKTAPTVPRASGSPSGKTKTAPAERNPSNALTTPKPLPTIRFVADPAAIQGNSASRISWTTTGATRVSITPSIGRTGLKTSDSVTVRPRNTTTYRLKAEGPGGSAFASLLITVSAQGGSNTAGSTDQASAGGTDSTKQPQESAPLEIRTFEAVPDNEGFRLVWAVSGANSEQCKLSVTDENGTLIGSDLPTVHQEGLSVSPTTETKYVLRAVCGDKTLSQTITVAPKKQFQNNRFE